MPHLTPILSAHRVKLKTADQDDVREHVDVFRRLTVGCTMSVNDAKGVSDSLLMEVDGEVTKSILGDVVWARRRATLFAARLLPLLSS
jgi:hypothetical protein